MGNNDLFGIDDVNLIFEISLFCSPLMNFKLVWFPIFPGCPNERPRRKRTGYPTRIFHLKAVASVTLDPICNNFHRQQT